VDTYLSPRPPRRPVRVNQSGVGVNDFIESVASLDPRLERGVTPFQRPTADAGTDFSSAFGASFTLDAGRSRAAPERRLTDFRWNMEH
jgi:hypothetical protein